MTNENRKQLAHKYTDVKQVDLLFELTLDQWSSGSPCRDGQWKWPTRPPVSIWEWECVLIGRCSASLGSEENKMISGNIATLIQIKEDRKLNEWRCRERRASAFAWEWLFNIQYTRKCPASDESSIIKHSFLVELICQVKLGSKYKFHVDLKIFNCHLFPL